MRTNQGPSTATAAPAKATNVARRPVPARRPGSGSADETPAAYQRAAGTTRSSVGISQPGTTPARTPAPSRHASETGSAEIESLDTTTPATCPCRSPCSSTGPSTVLRTGYLDTRASDAQSMPRVSRRSGSRRSARARPAGRGRPISSTLSALTSYRAGGGLTGPRVANSSNSWRSPSRARLWARPGRIGRIPLRSGHGDQQDPIGAAASLERQRRSGRSHMRRATPLRTGCSSWSNSPGAPVFGTCVPGPTISVRLART